MSNRQFYKTVITLIVLHEQPIPDDTSVGEVWRNCTEGDWVGDDKWEGPEILDGKQAAQALIEARSDPEFFQLDEQGNDLPEADESATVDLIAGGYEWTCPECDHDNKEIEITETVTCASCDHEFQVGDIHHAHG